MLDSIVERTQDFTDSAYTSHDHRQNIIMLSDRARLEMTALVRLPGVSSSHMDTEPEQMLAAGENTVMAVRWWQNILCTVDVKGKYCCNQITTFR